MGRTWTAKMTKMTHKQAAAAVLDRALGEDVVAALRDGFLKGDLTGVIPLLTADAAKPHLRRAVQDIFAAACHAGEDRVFSRLLQWGVDGHAALESDYEYDTDEDEHPDENEQGDTVLTRAARNGNRHVVRTLAASGQIDVNKPAPNGELPLTQAIYAKDLDCVEVLLAADGINPNLAG